MSATISAVFAIARSRLHAAADPVNAVRTATATSGTTISAIGNACSRPAPAVRAAPTRRQRWTSQITQAASTSTPPAMLPFAAVATAAPAATSVATTNASFASAYPRLEISHTTPIGTSRRPAKRHPGRGRRQTHGEGIIQVGKEREQHRAREQRDPEPDAGELHRRSGWVRWMMRPQRRSGKRSIRSRARQARRRGIRCARDPVLIEAERLGPGGDAIRVARAQSRSPRVENARRSAFQAILRRAPR